MAKENEKKNYTSISLYSMKINETEGEHLRKYLKKLCIDEINQNVEK